MLFHPFIDSVLTALGDGLGHQHIHFRFLASDVHHRCDWDTEVRRRPPEVCCSDMSVSAHCGPTVTDTPPYMGQYRSRVVVAVDLEGV